MQAWKNEALGDVLSEIRNGVNCKQDKSGVGNKVTRIETIADAKFDFDRVGYARLSEKERKKFRLQIGDILFSHINSAVHVGKTAVLEHETEIFHGVNLLLLRTSERVLPRFLDYFLKMKFHSGYWRMICKQSVNQASVNQKDVKKIPVQYPSLPEQRRIVAILDEALEGIDNAIANTEQNLANAQGLFESHLNQIFGRERNNWEVRNLGDVADNLDSKRVPITKSKRVKGDIPYYGASGIVDYVADFIFDEDLLLVSEDGANLLARTYPIAFSISGKSWVNNHAHVLRFSDFCSQQFVEYYLNSISLEPYVSGMAQPKLNQKALNGIPVPFPSIDIQQTVVDQLHALSSNSDRLKSIYQQKLDVLAELKQSILHKAFTGELTAHEAAA